MTRAEFDGVPRGTQLLVGDKFTSGDDEDTEPVKHLLNGVITLTEVSGEWVCHEEVPDTPFHVSEIVGVLFAKCIDDENVDYQPGDMGLIFGEGVV